MSQGNGERLVMNRKGPWEGYRRQAKRRLARCLLPAFLCAHIFVERETSGYEAELVACIVLVRLSRKHRFVDGAIIIYNSSIMAKLGQFFGDEKRIYLV